METETVLPAVSYYLVNTAPDARTTLVKIIVPFCAVNHAYFMDIETQHSMDREEEIYASLQVVAGVLLYTTCSMIREMATGDVPSLLEQRGRGSGVLELHHKEGFSCPHHVAMRTIPYDGGHAHH